jgi:GNAT superfamily N-acetyltransferase
VSGYFRLKVEDPRPHDAGEIAERLIAFNRKSVGRPDPQRYVVTLREEDGALRGGIEAILHWDVVFIDTFWIDEDLRGRKLGAQLIAAAEAEALRRGAAVAYLDTFSWQARPFYEKQGYVVFGTLPYGAGKHERFFMTKRLEPK